MRILHVLQFTVISENIQFTVISKNNCKKYDVMEFTGKSAYLHLMLIRNENMHD